MDTNLVANTVYTLKNKLYRFSKEYFFGTTLVSLEEVCGMSSFEVLNCWLNLVASCLDIENETKRKPLEMA